MKTLQEQYNQIKEGKGHKGIFLTEAKKKFPNMLTNPMGFEETTKILKNRGVINENYIDLQPVNSYESSAKEPWETKFNSFLKEQEEKIKAEAKKTDKSVEELADKNYDYKDYKNLDNQIGQEVMNGVYFEAKQNPDKSIDEIKKIVAKNLDKDSQYYMKNAAFGVEGLGYQEAEVEEVSGKHKSSGYSDKLKKMVKESLTEGARGKMKGGKVVTENDYDNRNLYIQRLKEGDRLLVDMGDGTQEELTVARTFIMSPPKGKRQPAFTSKEYGEDMWFTNDMVIKPVKEGIHDFDITSASHTNAGVRSDMSQQEEHIRDYMYIRQIDPILEKHDVDFEEFIKMAEVDNLTPQELDDLDYVEDRIMAHLSHKDTHDGLGNKLNEVDEEAIEKTKELTQAVKDLDKAKEEAGIEEEEKPTKQKKKKKQTTDDRLAEIDKQAEIVALEAKLDALSEIIESKEQRISMVNEDDNLSELVDKKRIKEMQKEIKVLEKRKAKMEKIYEKKCGKPYQQEAIIDESTEEDNE
jgi:hypothetical protein